MIRLLAAVCVLVMLASCMTPPQPLQSPPFVSPIAAPVVARIHLPLLRAGLGPARTAKKGIGLTYPYCDDVRWVGATWYYTWGHQLVMCDGLEAVPMLWDETVVGRSLGGNSDYVMGFNEPDQPGQANITPEDAAKLWRAVEIAYPDRLLVAPAPSERDPAWLMRFREAYLTLYQYPPRLDALAAHCYAGTAAACKQLVRQYISWVGTWDVAGGVWVTEFGFAPCLSRSWNEANAELRTFVNWLQAEPTVTRYAAFASRIRGDEGWAANRNECNTPLINALTGRRTALGDTYAALPEREKVLP